MSVYLGVCAHCGVGKNSPHFRSRPSGRAFEVSDFVLVDSNGLKLPFFENNSSNDRICNVCYRNNLRARGPSLQTPVRPPKKRARTDIPDKPDASTPLQRSNSSTSSVLVVTPKPRNTKRRSICDILQSEDVEMSPSKESSVPRMPGRSESAHRQAEEAAASLPSQVLVSSGWLVTQIMTSPCSNIIDGRICGGKLKPAWNDTKGRNLLLNFGCSSCKAFTCCKVPKKDTARVESDDSVGNFLCSDVLEVLMNFLSGGTEKSYCVARSHDPRRVRRSTYYSIQKLLCSVLEEAKEKSLSDLRKSMLADFESGQRHSWEAALNGAWSHAGWTARQHTFQIRDVHSNRVVCSIVLAKSHYYYTKEEVGGEVVATPVYEGNYIGSSRAMENEAFLMALEQLRADGLLRYLNVIVADGDLGVMATLQGTNDTKHIRLAGDPGHAKKNFFKAMKTVFGAQGKYKGLPYRISNFWMRCVKRAEKVAHGHTQEAADIRYLEFTRLWGYALKHYTSKECLSSCPCNEFFAGKLANQDIDDQDIDAAEGLHDVLENLVENLNNMIDDEEVVLVPECLIGDEDPPDGAKMRYTKKQYLDNSKPKEQLMIRQLEYLMGAAEKTASQVLWALNTCMSENSNSRRLRFCRKDRFFFASYIARSCLSTLLENLGYKNTYELLSEALGLKLSDGVLGAMEKLEQDSKYHSERKKSAKYNLDQQNGKLWKIAHNEDIKEEALEKRKAKVAARKASTYQTAESDGVQPYLGISKGRKNQEELAKLYDKELANRCSMCGKFYSKNGRHTRCSGEMKEAKLKTNKRQEGLKKKFEIGKAHQCENCGMYYSGSHKRCPKRKQKPSDDEGGTLANVSELNEVATVPEVTPFERSSSEDSSKFSDRNVRKRVRFSPSVHDDEQDNADEGEDIDEGEALDEDEALLRGVLFPTEDDIKNRQMDKQELNVLETPNTWTEATTLTYYAFLLQRQALGMENGFISALVYGPQLLLESYQKSVRALKDLLEKVFPHHVIIMLLTRSGNHFFVADLNIGGNSVTIYDSLSRDTLDSKEVRKNYSSRALEALYTYVFGMNCATLTWAMAQNMPQQSNSSDCGIFAMEVARSLVATYKTNEEQGLVLKNDGYSKLKPQNVMKYRRRLRRELQTNVVDLNERP